MPIAYVSGSDRPAIHNIWRARPCNNLTSCSVGPARPMTNDTSPVLDPAQPVRAQKPFEDSFPGAHKVLKHVSEIPSAL